MKKLKEAFAKMEVSPLPVTEATIPEQISLNPRQREHRAWMEGRGYGEWDTKANGLNTHTCHVREMAEHFNLPGEFETCATGKDGAAGRNCILFPKDRGLWLCARYGAGGETGKGWKMSANGNATCIVGKAPTKSKDDPADLIVFDAIETDIFFNYEGIAYVQVSRKGKKENLPVESTAYHNLLSNRYYEQYKHVCKIAWLKNAIVQLSACAIETKDETPAYVRMAFLNGKMYIDLADESGSIVEIDADDWRIVQEAPVRFLRNEKMQALPLPQREGSLNEIKQFINISDEDFPLLVGAILGCFHPTGPYPIIHFIGGEGSAKTSAAIFIQSLIDPSVVRACSPPDRAEDLILSVREHWLYFIDNVSKIDPWLSDAVCRLSTGGSLVRRKLYNDSETSAFRAKRPIIITSILDVMKAPDLISRTLKFDLPRISDYKSEAALWEHFNLAQPKIIGALYTAISAAIKNLPTTTIENTSRLADFLLWVQAGEAATGLEPGSILTAFNHARGAALESVLSGAIAQKILAMKEDWKGTGKELAVLLGASVATDSEIRGTIGELRTLQTALAFKGVMIDFKKSHGKNLIIIQKTEQ